MEKKINLFDIDAQILRLLTLDESDIVDAETGEVLIDVYEELDKLGMKRNEKIVNIARYIDDLERECKLLEEKTKSLTDRTKSKKRRTERLKAYILQSMVKLDTKKIEDETVSIRLMTTKVVNITDKSLIPEDYLNKTVEISPDRRRLLAELKNGKVIPGVELTDNYSIIVR